MLAPRAINMAPHTHVATAPGLPIGAGDPARGRAVAS